MIDWVRKMGRIKDHQRPVFTNQSCPKVAAASWILQARSIVFYKEAKCKLNFTFTKRCILQRSYCKLNFGMSRRVRTEDTSLRITFESLTFFPLLVCRGVWELRKPHYGSHSSLSLSSLYWYVAACENGRNLTMDHIRVTLCHKYIMIARSMQNSLLTFAYFRNLHFHEESERLECDP
jgi:hypothetical protein